MVAMMRIYEYMPGRLYLSARTHTLTDNEVRGLIGDHDITGVMNMWHTPDARVRELVGWYEQKHMPDGKMTAEGAIVAEYAAVRVERHIKEGGTALVHCWGGRNRSALVVALVLMRMRGLTGAEAIDAVKKVRRGTLANEHFKQYLMDRTLRSTTGA